MNRWSTIFALLALGAARTLPGPPAPPTITEPEVDGALVAYPDAHMEAEDYSDPDGDPHASTDWEIVKVSSSETVWQAPAAAGLGRLHLHLADGSFIGTYAGRTELEPSTDYRLRVRFRDAAGETSPWVLRLFTTTPTGPPGVDAPLPWIPSQHGFRIERVAGGFRLPVNLAFLPAPGPAPSDPLFYVTELYGTIRTVSRDGTVGTYASGLLNYDPALLGSFPGAGEQGLTGLCVDPLSGDVFVSALYQSGAARYPRIVRLHSTDGGRTGVPVDEFQMPGETQGQSHQVSHLGIGPDGCLYVHNGDGFDYTTAQSLGSYRGKILRMTLDLDPVADNPAYNGAPIGPEDYVWALGLRNPFGGGWRPATGEPYVVENGPGVDRFARAVKGRNFGWDNTNSSMSNFALHVWNPATAPVNLAFVDATVFSGSGFPASRHGRAYVTESGPTYAAGPQVRGKRITEWTLGTGDSAPSATSVLAEYNGTGRGTAAALAAGPDGLYFSDLYKDQGASAPADAGAWIYRIRHVGVPSAGSGTGARGEYHDADDFSGTPVVRTDPTVDFSWPSGTPPVGGVAATTFSARWTARVEPPSGGDWTFYTQSDDGVRLWVNGHLLVNNWTSHASVQNAGTLALQGGSLYDLVLEYYQGTGDARIELRWSSPSNPKEIVPAGRLHAPDLRDNDGDGLGNTLDFDDDGDGIEDHDDPDRDGDGVPDAVELSAGSDPDDSASVPLAGGGGGGGGCGLLGLEVLLLGACFRKRRVAAVS